jgi:hypothetical protein
MALASLDNLVRTGALKAEAPEQSELDGLIRSGLARLEDASNTTLSLDGRFDLAYNAALACVALPSVGESERKVFLPGRLKKIALHRSVADSRLELAGIVDDFRTALLAA